MICATLLFLAAGTVLLQHPLVNSHKQDKNQTVDGSGFDFIVPDAAISLNGSELEAVPQRQSRFKRSWADFQVRHILTRGQVPASKQGWVNLMRDRRIGDRETNTFIFVNSVAEVDNLRNREFTVQQSPDPRMFRSQHLLTVYLLDYMRSLQNYRVKTGQDYVIVAKNGAPVHLQELVQKGRNLIEVNLPDTLLEPTTNDCGECFPLGTKCYLLARVDKNLTNLEAVQGCNVVGGTLPYFNNELDYTLFKTWGCAGGENSNREFWLGYYNFQSHSQIEPGIWKTLSGEIPSFTDFHAVEPNNDGGMEFCAVDSCHLQRHTWNDYLCHMNNLQSYQLLCQCPIRTAECIWQEWSECSSKVAECAGVCDSGECEGRDLLTCQPCVNCFDTKARRCLKCLKNFKMSLTTKQLRRPPVAVDSQCTWEDWLQCGVKVAQCLPACGTCVVEFITCPTCLTCFGNSAAHCIKCLTKFLRDPLSIY